MILSFTLSMPSANSWNGKWSGEDTLYARTINFGKGKKAVEEAQAILKTRYYSYSFGDGWVAGVTVKEVKAKEAATIRKKSRGFCGYDWMIDSIRDHGMIKTKPRPIVDRFR
jgi:hypothetical protein